MTFLITLFRFLTPQYVEELFSERLSTVLSKFSCRMAQQPVPPGPPGPSCGSVFFAFFRLGITAFGGPAMVSYIRKMEVGKKGWLDGVTFDDGICTLPGDSRGYCHAGCRIFW